MSKETIIKMNLSIALSTLFILVLIITSGVIVTRVNGLEEKIKTTNEQMWRAQARSTLLYLKNNFVKDISEKRFNPMDDYDVQLWGENRLLGLKNGSPSSDAFVVEMGKEKFLYDGSTNCASDFIINEKFIKDNYAQHFNPRAATIAYDEMRKGYDTIYGSNNFWYFTENKEWLEWIFIPHPQVGLDGIASTIGGIKNKNFRNIMIQLGTQSDEVEKPWSDVLKELNDLKLMLYIICTVVIILSFIFGIFFIIKVKNLEHCDCK